MYVCIPRNPDATTSTAQNQLVQDHNNTDPDLAVHTIYLPRHIMTHSKQASAQTQQRREINRNGWSKHVNIFNKPMLRAHKEIIATIYNKIGLPIYQEEYYKVNTN
jgi:hypothetical protein